MNQYLVALLLVLLAVSLTSYYYTVSTSILETLPKPGFVRAKLVPPFVDVEVSADKLKLDRIIVDVGYVANTSYNIAECGIGVGETVSGTKTYTINCSIPPDASLYEIVRIRLVVAGRVVDY